MNQTLLPSSVKQELLYMISSIGIVFEDRNEGEMPVFQIEPESTSLSLLICELAEFGHYPHEEQKRFILSLDCLIDQ